MTSSGWGNGAGGGGGGGGLESIFLGARFGLANTFSKSFSIPPSFASPSDEPMAELEGEGVVFFLYLFSFHAV